MLNSKSDVMAELQSLIQSKAVAKTAAAKVKVASPGDGVDNYTAPPVTGDQMAKNNSLAGQNSAGMVDAGAKDNPENASRTNSPSTQSVGAAELDGQGGSTGGEHESKRVLVVPGNEPAKVAQYLRAHADELTKIAQYRQDSVTGIHRFLVSQYRGSTELAKVAADAGMDDAAIAQQAGGDLHAGLANGQVSEEQAQQILAEAVQSGAITVEDLQAAEAEAAAAQGGAPQGAPQVAKTAHDGSAPLSGIHRFLVHQFRSNSNLAKVAADAGMDDAAIAQQAGGDLHEGLANGQVSEEQAQQILAEAVQSGAITVEDLQAAEAEAAAAQGGAPQGAQGGDPTGAQGGDPTGAQGAAPQEMVEDPAMQAKLASIDVGPTHPLYRSKLETLYPSAMAAGSDLCVKIAAELGFIKRSTTMPASENLEQDAVPGTNVGGDVPSDSVGGGKDPKVLSFPGDKPTAAPADAIDPGENLKAAAAHFGISEAEVAALMGQPEPKVASAKDQLFLSLAAKMVLKGQK